MRPIPGSCANQVIIFVEKEGFHCYLLEEFDGLVTTCGPRLGPALPDNNINGLDFKRKQQSYNCSNSHPRPVNLRHTFPEGAREAHGRVVVASGRVNTRVIVTRYDSLIGVELLPKPIRTAVVAVIGLWA